MCVGVIGRVRATTADTLVVETSGRTARVCSMTLDQPAPVGSWVLIHSGFALAVLSDREAEDALRLRTDQDEQS